MKLVFHTTLMILSCLMISASEHPPRSPVVVGFGDSTTAGRSYCTVLAARISGITVENRGIGGNTTAMAAARFERDVLSINPDLVIIQFGINDAAVDVWKDPPATKSRVSRDDYRNNLRSFVTTLKERGTGVVLMTPNAVRWAPRTLELYGKPPYDPDDALGFTRILAGYAEAVRQLAAELDVPLIDVYSMYDDPQLTDKDFKRLLPDGMHPSATAHQKTAAALTPIIVDYFNLPPEQETGSAE
jgi:lysophospholipase L1-like esterase